MLSVMCAAYLSRALVLPVDDSVLQLVRVDVSDGELTAVLIHSGKWVCHSHGGLALVLAHF